MRGLTVFLAALALSVPGVAQAQTQKPDPMVIDENTMMGRSPRLPADRLVPANAAGELAGVRGKAWWQVLMWCAGAYRFRHDELDKAGDKAGAAATEETGMRFIGMAVDRLVVDRGITIDDTVPILTPEANYAYAGAADGGETYRPFKVDEMRCREVELRYMAMVTN